ncbi:hypothetical protein BJY01DRAFT_254195, partial [Aspergillus pseudoustus]
MAMIKSKYTVDPPSTDLLSYLLDTPYNNDGGWPESEPILLSAGNPTFPGYTLSEIKSIVKRLGNGLNRLGCKGKRVMLYGNDNLHFGLALLGIVAAGATGNVLAASPVEYLVDRLRQLDCETILFAPQDLNTVRAAAAELGLSEEGLFVVDESLHAEPSNGGYVESDGIRHWSYLLEALGGEEYEWPRLSPDEAKTNIAILIYTSGTTGTSKLAERTDYGLVGSIESALYHYNLEQTYRETVVCQYKFSGMGFLILGLLLPLKARWKTIFPAPFDLRAFTQIVDLFKPTVYAAPKHLLRAILALPARPDLSSIRHVPTGGAVMGFELIDEWQTVFGSQIQS